MDKSKLTPEQAEIVQIDVAPGATLKINAFAGTGKTTTLTAYAEARPTQTFLYLAFNASAANDAKRRFPSNTTCRTIHSLAWASHGQNYHQKLARSNIRPNVIQEFLGAGHLDDRVSRRDAQRILATVQNYLNSAESDLSTRQVPEDDKSWDALHEGLQETPHLYRTIRQEIEQSRRRVGNEAKTDENVPNHGGTAEFALKFTEALAPNFSRNAHLQLLSLAYEEKVISRLAQKVWQAMQDPEENRIPMLHDGYLKLFQLSKPRLNYDGIFLDEGQDTNPVTLSLFLAQNRTARIIVGDRYQSIYQFRGATNAMALIPATTERFLTTSFRFGPDIAQIANLILHDFYGETKTLVGLKNQGGVGAVDDQRNYTVIARTNGILFQKAVEAIETAQWEHRSCQIGFVATQEKDNYSPVKPYGLDLLADIHALWRKQKDQIRDPYISRFKDFGELVKQAQGKTGGPDPELASKVLLVEKYREKLPEKIELVVRHSVNPQEAQILFTTAHRAKGLEWSQVQLANDFHDLMEAETQTDPTSPLVPIKLTTETEQELNLLYVAVTRAKDVLEPNESINTYRRFIHKIEYGDKPNKRPQGQEREKTDGHFPTEPRPDNFNRQPGPKPDATKNQDDPKLAFGAHRGKRVSELNESYLKWLLDPVLDGGQKKFNVPPEVQEAARTTLQEKKKIMAPALSTPCAKDLIAQTETERLAFHSRQLDPGQDDEELSRKAQQRLNDLFSP